MRTTITLLALAACMIAANLAEAAPYIPDDDDAVLEHLPDRNDPLQRELRALRAQVAATPRDLALAARLARRYIEAGRVGGDPRYLGYAQAVLGPWWNAQRPPVEARLLRATILQSRHRFDPALVDLDAVLQDDPANAQALLTRATILQVQGHFEQAKASCGGLYALAPQIVTVTCIANAASLSGQLPGSYTLLQSSLQRYPDADPGIKTWVRTLLAEMAQRRGDMRAAETYFRAVLDDGADSYALGAYADFLLDAQRPDEVISLLKDRLRVDALLLRYAEALKQQHAGDAPRYIEMLRARFDAARMRGDTVHRREQARFELHLLDDPQAALRTAQRNWEVQKEPADVRILLEAALAADDRDAVAAITDWIRRTGLQDKSLSTLTGKAGGAA